MAIYGDGKHDSEQTENKTRTYTVSIDGFEYEKAKNPLEAAKTIRKWIMENDGNVVYTVYDEETNEKFTVDLAEDDEDAVLREF
jgi:hypothetical protein